MGRTLQALTHFTYTKVARPLLFAHPPDEVHAKTVVFGEKISGARYLHPLIKWSWAYRHPMLEQTIHGISYHNPVGLAAGIDKNIQLVPVIEAAGFGHITGGSVTGKYCVGNKKPWFHRLPQHKAIAVHAGLGNQGSAAVAKRLRATLPRESHKIPLTVSIARTNIKESSTEQSGINDYTMGLLNMRRSANVFEINISCPNTYGGEPFTSPERLHRLLTAIDSQKLTQPVYIKMPSNLSWAEFKALLDVIVKHSVQGVTICNLRKDRKGLSVPKDVPGSISGKPIQQASDALIAKTYRQYGDRLTIIGVGGIFTAEDAYRKIKNGASLVELATGLIYEGPSIAGQINRGLVKLLKADGYTSIQQAIGTATKV